MSNISFKDFDIKLSRIKRNTKNIDKRIDSRNKNDSHTLENQKFFLKFFSKINNNNINKNYQIVNEPEKSHDKNYVSLSQLYNMPNNKTKSFSFNNKQKMKIELNKKNKIRNKLYLNNNFRFITCNNDNDNIHTVKKKLIKSKNDILSLHNSINKQRKIIDQFANLSNFMKDRFYPDIEEKLNRKFRNKPFYYDVSLKNKIIQLNQIKEFWGGLSDYTNPILCTKRVRYLSELIKYRKYLRENIKNEEKVKNKENDIFSKLLKKTNKSIAIPKLYTNSDLIEKRREDIKKIRLFSRERRNKTENNMLYLDLISFI